ncbi:MAG: carbamoyltransferase C-terminal domain-containing protein [Elusimicrobiota bacterium]|jgi:carbamoyltransferase
MKILGINAYHGDASAALLVDGKLMAFAAEERFNRIKHCAGFPEKAIRYCLSEAGLQPKDLSVITVSKDPKANFWAKAAHVVTHPKILSPSFLRSRLSQGRHVLDVRQALVQAFAPGFNGISLPIVHVEHHVAHVASAYYASSFDRAAILTIDGMGDGVSAILALGEGNQIRILKRVYFPHSLGFLYTAISQHLGFTHYGDEGKVMGLAAYGRASRVPEVRRLIHPLANGLLSLNLDYFQHQNGSVAEVWEKTPSYGPLFSSKINQLLGPARMPKSALNPEHEDLAFAVQAVTEELFFHLLHTLHRETGEKRLCFAGGVALNCVMNGKIQTETPFEQVYIQPDAGDGGTSLGGALYHAYTQAEPPPRFHMDHVYWGPQYSDAQIEAALRERGMAVQKDPEICGRTAQAIADGKITGWFQGRMEAGPRALGSRSILADPRRANMKSVLNARIKNREAFRPFAPSVLAEKCREWFDGPAESPFMLMNYIVKPERRASVPAITHVDGTARVQTVHRQTHPRYWELISAFERLTGVPVVLNTSFNEDEPIVCRPEEAIDCFLRTQMDLLVLGDYWIEKPSRASFPAGSGGESSASGRGG